MADAAGFAIEASLVATILSAAVAK